MRNRKIFVIVVVLCCGFIGVGSAMLYKVKAAKPRQSSKTVVFNNPFTDPRTRKAFPGASIEPVLITSVKVNGLPVISGNPFTADDDWFGTLEINVKNVSNRVVTGMKFDLDFIHTGEGVDNRSVDLLVGKQPTTAIPNGERSVTLQPGEEFVVKFDDRSGDHFEGYKMHMLHHNPPVPMSALHTAKIYATMFGFDNGEMWLYGRYYKPNPAAQGGWEKISTAREILPAIMQKAVYNPKTTDVGECFDVGNPNTVHCTPFILATIKRSRSAHFSSPSSVSF